MSAEKRTTIAISTSRRPSQRVRTFCREFSRALPQTAYLTRGSSSFQDLSIKTFEDGASRLIIVDSRRKNPDKIRIYRLEPGCLEEILTLRIVGHELKRERNDKSRVKEPSSITFEFHNIAEWLQKKLIDSFSPILTTHQSISEEIHTFFVSANNSEAQKAYTGKLIDPSTNVIVSPSFQFAIGRRDSP
ncbi:MAG: hypothetical protein ACFFGZ_12565 [Candidatus Thorarchaeota archaeon]